MSATGAAPELLPLQLRDVSVHRGGKAVLKSVNCCFDAPGRTLVIGPNGAGKSLFLMVCHGIVEPDAGLVLWPAQWEQAAIAKAQAMVFQRPVLLRRSVEQNVDFPLQLRGLSRVERRSRVSWALHRTGLTRYAKAPARALSFGEQQRLALARAISTEPQVLFLDEPCASLDPAAAHLVEEIVLELSNAGVKIIMSSHDLSQAKRLADEVIFLYRGRIKERAVATKFFEQPENDLAQAFLNGELLWWRRRSVFETGACE
ncbi:MAG: tungstate transport system ATP-binding protein [Gammaproteobacteria bacterium]|jgi:tungstate transport system ATP-binding protein